MALFNLSNTASATDVVNINTQITGINSDITGIKSKTDLLTNNGGNLETTTNLKVTGTLQSTQAITSGDDITAFGTVS